MAAPILYGSPWWWELNSDPTTNVDTDNGYIGYANLWRNTDTNNVFICTDAGDFQNNGLEWMYVFNIQSLPSTYSLRSSPAFNTSYLPSLTNNTMVSAVVSLSSTILLEGTVQFQIDTGSGFNTIGQSSISGIVATNIQTINCLVPAGANYKLVNSSGTASIISLNEIQL